MEMANVVIDRDPVLDILSLNNKIGTQLKSLQGTLRELKQNAACLETSNKCLVQQLEESRMENERLKVKLQSKDRIVKKLEEKPGKLNEPPTASFHPLSVFPAVIWVNIFQAVSNTEDLLRCTQTCKYFAEYLIPRRIKWILPLVLPCLEKYVTPDHLRTCRGVCKSWKQSVEKYLEDDLFSCRHHYNPFFNSEQILTFKKSEEIEAFQEDMSSFKTIFIVQSIHIQRWDWRESPTDYNFWQVVTKLLKVYRSQIKVFGIFISEPPNEALKILHSCLNHLPNLEKLSVRGYETVGELFDKCSVFVNKRKEKRMKKYFQRRPFPQLPGLTELEVIGMPEVFSEILLSVYGSHLNICWHPTDNSQLSDLSCVVNARIDDLTISLPCFSKNLNNFKSVTWPIATIELYNIYAKYEVIVKTLNQFGTTLRRLKLDVLNMDHGYHATEAFNSLNLPNLESFVFLIDVNIAKIHLDFIIVLKNLRRLEIYATPTRPNAAIKVKSSVQVAGYEVKMYESNIWKLLPRLQSFTFINSEDEPPVKHHYNWRTYEYLKNCKN